MPSNTAPGRPGSASAGARRERDRLRRELADRPIDEIAQAMCDQFGDRPRRAYREAHGWSLQQVADRYNDLEGSGTAPMSKQRISEWELWPEPGKRRFSVTGLAVLARVLGASTTQLLDRADQARLPAKDLLALEQPGLRRPAAGAGQDAPERAAVLLQRADPTDRADVPLASRSPDAPGWIRLVADAGDAASRFIRWAEEVNVGEHGVADLAARVAQVSRDHMHAPPLPTFTRAQALAEHAVRLLREGHQRPGDTLDLYLVAGQAYGLMAWIAGDLGQHGPAMTQAQTAWLCAERTGHSGLKAWARAVQAKVAYWAGRIEDAARYAHDGLAYPTADSAPVLLACMHARALARLRRTATALEALDVAKRARDNVSGLDMGGLYGFTPANEAHLRASALLWLSEPTSALRLARKSIEAYVCGDPEERFHGPLMTAHLDAAQAHVLLGQVDGALELVGPVLELAPDLRLDAFDQRLDSIREMLLRPAIRGSSPARELAGRIEGYRATARPRAITS